MNLLFFFDESFVTRVIFSFGLVSEPRDYCFFMWYDPPTRVYGRQVVQRLLNDTSQLARNLQQTKDEKDRILQALELMEEKMKAEIA